MKNETVLYTKFISFSIFIFFCFVSFAMFSSMLRTYERQVRIPQVINHVIVSSSDGIIRPGQIISYEGLYTKTEECVGTWTIRLRDSVGKLYILATGPMGSNKAGTYKIYMNLKMPDVVTEGNAVIMEDNSLVCTGNFVYVARNESDEFYIQNQNKETKESTLHH